MKTKLIIGLFVISLIFINGCGTTGNVVKDIIKEPTQEESKIEEPAQSVPIEEVNVPNIEEKPIESGIEVFQEDIVLKPKAIVAWQFEDDGKNKKINYKFNSERGIYVYFVVDSQHALKQFAEIDGSSEKFAYYDGCKKLSVRNLEDICNVGNKAGLMIANLGGEIINVNITLEVEDLDPSKTPNPIINERYVE